MWIAIKNNIPIGIFQTEEKLKAALSEGNYFMIPIGVDRLYDSLIDIGLPGAINYVRHGVDHDVENLTAEIGSLKSQLAEKEIQMTEFDTRIKIIEEKELVAKEI